MLPTQEQVSSVFPSKDFVKVQQLDIRREGQPISTDEFLRKLALGWKVAPTANDFQERSCLWLLGDFTAAMEGLE